MFDKFETETETEIFDTFHPKDKIIEIYGKKTHTVYDGNDHKLCITRCDEIIISTGKYRSVFIKNIGKLNLKKKSYIENLLVNSNFQLTFNGKEMKIKEIPTGEFIGKIRNIKLEKKYLIFLTYAKIYKIKVPNNIRKYIYSFVF